MLWTKEQDAHEHWALPEQGRSTGDVNHDHASRSTPDAILLGTSIFSDLDGGVERRIACTSRLAYDDLMEFSVSTPS